MHHWLTSLWPWSGVHLSMNLEGVLFIKLWLIDLLTVYLSLNYSLFHILSVCFIYLSEFLCSHFTFPLAVTVSGLFLLCLSVCLSLSFVVCFCDYLLEFYVVYGVLCCFLSSEVSSILAFLNHRSCMYNTL